MKNKTLHAIVTLIFSVLLSISCAEIEPPPGGEVDRQAPFLLGSTPQNGSTDVLPGNQVSIFFSEKIIKPENVKTVFISPRPANEPKVKWKSDRVDIIFADSFQVNQTYIVSLSSAVTDLRRNKIDSSLMVAFSTGSVIDSGSMSGVVIKDGKPVPGFYAALYDRQPGDDVYVPDSSFPSYQAQTNNEGRFSFAFLSEKSFSLIIFNDLNRDEQFNPDREPFALPDREIIVGGELPLDNLSFSVISRDTLTPDIISVSSTAERLIKVRLNKEIQTNLLLESVEAMRIWPIEDSTRVYKTLGLLEAGSETGSTFHFWMGELPPGEYRCQLTYDQTQADLQFDLFEVKKADDTHAPELLSSEPGEIPAALDKLNIMLTMSEPVDTVNFTEATFLLWDDTDRSLPLDWQMKDPFRIQLKSSQIEAGRTYRLAVTEFEIADMSGNLFGDSLSEFSFSTLDVDSLGSAQGSIITTLKSAEGHPVALNFVSVKNNQSYELITETSEFNIDLPAGKYLLSGYVDLNGDGKQNFGALTPFSYSETTVTYSDTIAVRARFETAGIEVEIK